ncbi:glutamate-cysteine ligase family protein [Pseudonocardia nematodicida]|uniref:Glutamate-cysteine ligase family protein n=1 Tax=Pseudonocardia nematodicida TaxID=1206997 RepID=A0ABV1KJ34_9PSEU
MRGAARYGIEHELALLRPDGTLADFASLTHAEVAAVVDELPGLPEGQADLRIGDAGIRRKHWYAEGYERLGEDGALTRFDPKGIEIRTQVHDSVDAVARALADDARLLTDVAARHGLRPVAIGHHPWRAAYRLDPPPNAHERAVLASSPEERTAHLHMLTWGPDLNLSFPEAGTDAGLLADAAAKLTCYSPFLVPWSFSSPFREGRPWGGLSARTSRRTGARPAALAYLDPGAPLLPTDPSLVRHAGIPGEVGRIEFKAFDAVAAIAEEDPADPATAGPALFGPLLSLLTGVLRDDTLTGRRRTPDAAAHRRAALRGWSDPAVRAGSQAVLDAATAALRDDDDPGHLDRLALLRERLDRRETPADRMLARYRAGGGVTGIAPTAVVTPVPSAPPTPNRT